MYDEDGVQGLVDEVLDITRRRTVIVLDHGGVELMSHLVDVGTMPLQFSHQLLITVRIMLYYVVFRLKAVLVQKAYGVNDHLGDIAVEHGIRLHLEQFKLIVCQSESDAAITFGFWCFVFFATHGLCSFRNSDVGNKGCEFRALLTPLISRGQVSDL